MLNAGIKLSSLILHFLSNVCDVASSFNHPENLSVQLSLTRYDCIAGYGVVILHAINMLTLTIATEVSLENSPALARR